MPITLDIYFRCRNCGVVYPIQQPTKDVEQLNIAVAHQIMGMRPVAPHRCSDKTFGFAEMVRIEETLILTPSTTEINHVSNSRQ